MLGLTIAFCALVYVVALILAYVVAPWLARIL